MKKNELTAPIALAKEIMDVREYLLTRNILSADLPALLDIWLKLTLAGK